MTKTIFITGATAGIGKACAELFAKEGCRLILLGRKREKLAELEKSLNAPVISLVADVRDREKVFDLIAKLPEDFARIDVLVNNAGLAQGLASADEASLADWDTMIDTNIKGLVNATKAILPGMVARDSGHIVNLSSIAGSYYYPGGNVYGATKAFVTQFSGNLRIDLLGKNIRITNIEPGMVETEFSVTRFHGDKQRANEVYRDMDPLTAEDIAETIRWCVAQPAHVNVSRLEVMPVRQAIAGPKVSRKE